MRKTLDIFEESDLEEAWEGVTCSMEPVAVFDAAAERNSWQRGWLGEEDGESDWELRFYPVMPDGTMLVTYSLEPFHKKGTAVETYFRTLAVRPGKNGAVVKERYRFSLSGDAYTVLRCGIKLWAVQMFEGEYNVVQAFPFNKDSRFSLGRDVAGVTYIDNGRIAVIYDRNLNSERKAPLKIFSLDTGDCVAAFRHPEALYCMDCELDANGHLWATPYPSAYVEEIDPEDGSMVEHIIDPCTFWNAMAMTEDNSLLLAVYTDNGSMLAYALPRDEEGHYGPPVRFDFAPTDEEGHVLTPEDCRVFGNPSTMKSNLVLRVEDSLWWFDLNRPKN